jgi:hypothetical protein
MSEFVDISGIDKRKLLMSLFTHAKGASFFEVSRTPLPAFNEEEFETCLKYECADYLCGRYMKVNFKKKRINVTRCSEEKLAQQIIQELKR